MTLLANGDVEHGDQGFATLDEASTRVPGGSMLVTALEPIRAG